MSLTNEQVDALLAPLDPRRVKQANGQSHLEAWDVRRHLIRVFGWTGWTFEVVQVDCILERSLWEDKSTHKGRHSVAYRVIGRLVVRDENGFELTRFEDGATGDALNQPSFGDAHDMALKTAMSQALKRCAVNLGDRFGLSLYNKGATGAVVGKTLAHASTVEHEAAEEVTGGELDDVREGGAPSEGQGSNGGETSSSASPAFQPEGTARPALASFDEHDWLRKEIAGLDADEKKKLVAWWKQHTFPSITDKDVLSAGQFVSVCSFLDELHEAREANDGNDLAARAQAMAARKAAERPEDVRAKAAGE